MYLLKYLKHYMYHIRLTLSGHDYQFRLDNYGCYCEPLLQLNTLTTYLRVLTESIYVPESADYVPERAAYLRELTDTLIMCLRELTE